MPSPDEIFKILGVLCVEYGFCLPESVAREICNRKGLDALGLARAVVKAEGLDPDYSEQVSVLEAKISKLLGLHP